MAIRNYKTSSEIRRVVKNLKTYARMDKIRLASIRRSINLASLRDSRIEVDAARKPIKKPIKKPVARSAKAPAKPTKKPTTRTTKNDADIFTVRGPSSGGKGVKVPVKKAPNNKAIQNLTELLSLRQERLQIAEHIRQLLVHHFDQDDRTVSRLVKVVESLVKESRQLFAETENTLGDMSQSVISPEFIETVEYISEKLQERFDGRFDNVEVKFSVAVKPGTMTKTKGINSTQVDNSSTYHIGYIVFDNLESSNATQDYVVAIVRVITGRREQDFVRTLTDYRPPSWFIKHSPGIAFSDAERALKLIYNTMAMEDMLDVAEKTQLPIKKHHVMYQSDAVQETDIDEKEGTIKIFLKSTVKDTDVRKVLIDLFAETKALVKAIHPRYKNPVKALTPKKVTRSVKLKNGSTKKVTQWVLQFAFAKMQEGEPIQVSRDKVSQFMETFEIDDPETVRDFNKLLRNFLGVR